MYILRAAHPMRTICDGHLRDTQAFDRGCRPWTGSSTEGGFFFEGHFFNQVGYLGHRLILFWFVILSGAKDLLHRQCRSFVAVRWRRLKISPAFRLLRHPRALLRMTGIL